MPKDLKDGSLWDCEISIMLQNVLKIEGGTLKNFRKKNEKLKNKKVEPVSGCRKLGRGDPLGFSKFQFAVKYQKI